MFEQELYPWLHVPCYVENLSPICQKALALGSRRVFKRGECFGMPDDIRSFGYIQSGIACQLLLDYENGRDEIRFFIGPRSLVRDTFVMAGYDTYRSSHKCLTDVVVWEFDKKLLCSHEFITMHRALQENFAFSIAVKGVSAQLFTSLLKRKNNEQKIAVFLYGFYLLNSKRLCFVPPFSQHYLAQLLGISKLTVNRIIAAWKKEKIIASYTKKRLDILDVDRLRRLRG